MNRYLSCVAKSFLLASGFSTPVCFASESVKYPKLIMHGQKYLNACDPVRKVALQNMLLVHNVKASKQAWRVIDAILCSPDDDKNRAYVRGIIQKRVRMSLESTGETPTVQLVERTDELIDEILAAGRAWEASLQVDSAKIILQYFANEACVEAISLSFASGKWTVSDYGVACD
jgi:hypothetical protein